MAAKKLMNVHEALEYSENLDVSSENDLYDNEDFISSQQKSAGATVDLSTSRSNILPRA